MKDLIDMAKKINPMTGKYIDVEFGEHGLVFISDSYETLK